MVVRAVFYVVRSTVGVADMVNSPELFFASCDGFSSLNVSSFQHQCALGQ